jgi:diguanylate cyclase (GGDEF)-like protein
VNLKAFYTTLLSVLATVVALSVVWEFWLEDWLLPNLIPYHAVETWGHRWEFVATAATFSFLALMVPAVIGTRIIRRDQILRQTVIRLSQEDYLTGLYNRRRITELLAIEIRRATRYKTTFSYILTDVDHFKAVNDRFGHQAGDEVLTRIAEVIRSSVRATDLVGRWGGEEFVIILPETEIGGGLSLAGKIRTRLESADLGEIGHRTASFGVTAFADGDDIEDISARADAGLYAAKQGGRNRVEMVPARAKEGKFNQPPPLTICRGRDPVLLPKPEAPSDRG